MKSIIWTFVFLLISIPAWAVKPPAITTTSCPQGQTTVVYTGCNVQGRWGTKPYTFSIVSGTLPTGLALNTVSSVGQITGTPSVVGTFGFKVRLTDSEGSPKTYDQQLYISIIATPVPPANPVQITTSTPLPSGLVGTAYATTVQAQNGTLTYTWSLPVGTLPAGLALNTSTGAITGTPTAPGTSSFTIKVTDSSMPAGTAQQNYYIAISNPIPAPTYLFSDDFESGTFGAWTSVNDATHTVIQSSIKHGGTYAAQMHYVKCSDSTNPSCGSSHADVDYYVEKLFGTDSLTEIWTRGYFYIKTPEPGADPHMQRKLFYFTAGCFSCSQFPSGDPWSMFVAATQYSTDTLPGAGPMKLKWSLQNGPIGGGTLVSDCGTTNPDPITGIGCALQYDTWYSLETRVKYNTNAVAPFNGEVQIWINGTSVYNQGTWSLNRNTTYHLRLFRYGEQVDRLNYLPVDEYRFWDDIILNNAYIGP
jgi:hypothetical protein